MKPSQRLTLALKVKACQFCKLADKAKMRQGRQYCDSADIRDGHCRNFQSKKPKEVKGE